jgi:hypothetical protein
MIILKLQFIFLEEFRDEKRLKRFSSLEEFTVYFFIHCSSRNIHSSNIQYPLAILKPHVLSTSPKFATLYHPIKIGSTAGLPTLKIKGGINFRKNS